MPNRTYAEAARSGKLADPEARRERARKAGQAAHSLDKAVQRVVQNAPELTDEQVDQLRRTVGGAQ